jgi:hypothetical protein
MIRAPVGVAALCLTVVWVASGCRERPRAIWEAGGPAAARVPVDSATAARNAALEPGALATVDAVPVKGWTGPGNRPFEVARRSAAPEGGHARTFGTITLPIVLRNRVATLSQYPCTSCHAGRKIVMASQRIGHVHENIQPVHPKQTGALCSTCHAEENVELLVLKSGERASVDESYRLCGQCHFAQADAWAAGGHGKRLDGWEGRRIVMACTDCHDPHNPGVQPRIPFRAPQLERPGATTHE